MESRQLQFQYAKNLLVSSGYKKQIADRIIATAGLHEGRLNDIARFEGKANVKNQLSMHLAIYPPAVVRKALDSGVNLDDYRAMDELVKAHRDAYTQKSESLPELRKVTPESCNVWLGKLKTALANSTQYHSKSYGFTGQLEVYNAREFASPTEDNYRLGGLGLVLYPSKHDEQDLKRRGARLDLNYEHMPGSLGFARFYIADGRLIVSNLQSDLAKSRWHESERVRDSIRKRYRQWDRYMLRALEDIARNAGLKEIVMCTANHVYEKYGSSMDPHKVYHEYAVLPQSEGYSLKETSWRTFIVGRHRAKNLFWVKPVKP